MERVNIIAKWRLTGGRLISRLLQFFFHLLYHQLAWAYDLVAATVSLGQWRAWVFSILPDLPGERVLEIGHGPGHLLLALSLGGRSVFGMDASRQMGRIAYRRLADSRQTTNLITAIAQALPYKSAVFHQVACTFPSNYIADQRALAEIYRVLPPGGFLVVVPVAWLTGTRWIERLTAWYVRLAGQSPEWGMDQSRPFTEAGFRLSVEYRKFKSSQVLVLIGQKPM